MSNIKLQQELTQWRFNTDIDYCIAVTWHVPNTMRYHQNGYDDIWLSKTLTCYFNKVDRRLFKAAHRNRTARLPRFVFLEHTDGVGWHAHGYLAKAPNITTQATIEALEAIWHKHCKQYKTQAFEHRLFWAEKIDADYYGYASKQAFSGNQIHSGKLDVKNIVTAYKH